MMFFLQRFSFYAKIYAEFYAFSIVFIYAFLSQNKI